MCSHVCLPPPPPPLFICSLAGRTPWQQTGGQAGAPPPPPHTHTHARQTRTRGHAQAPSSPSLAAEGSPAELKLHPGSGAGKQAGDAVPRPGGVHYSSRALPPDSQRAGPARPHCAPLELLSLKPETRRARERERKKRKENQRERQNRRKRQRERGKEGGKK